jgi:predicted TIM-barrel fold metal-dependent hydrolase
LFRGIGTDCVLFGTNYPFVDPAEYVEKFKRAPCPTKSGNQICCKNDDRVCSVADGQL